MSLQSLSDAVVAFRNERDWAQFHTVKNLSAALAIEAAELQELLLWKDDGEADDFVRSKSGHREVSDEVADVMIYALLLCDIAGIDPSAAIRVKLEKNASKYPVGLAKGSAVKYDKLPRTE
jgi:NTP pyrophosphatase (non-canonical NTP hydrolase)